MDRRRSDDPSNTADMAYELPGEEGIPLARQVLEQALAQPGALLHGLVLGQAVGQRAAERRRPGRGREP